MSIRVRDFAEDLTQSRRVRGGIMAKRFWLEGLRLCTQTRMSGLVAGKERAASDERTFTGSTPNRAGFGDLTRQARRGQSRNEVRRAKSEEFGGGGAKRSPNISREGRRRTKCPHRSMARCLSRRERRRTLTWRRLATASLQPGLSDRSLSGRTALGRRETRSVSSAGNQRMAGSRMTCRSLVKLGWRAIEYVKPRWGLVDM